MKNKQQTQFIFNLKYGFQPKSFNKSFASFKCVSEANLFGFVFQLIFFILFVNNQSIFTLIFCIFMFYICCFTLLLFVYIYLFIVASQTIRSSLHLLLIDLLIFSNQIMGNHLRLCIFSNI